MTDTDTSTEAVEAMAQALLDKWGNLVVPSTLCALAAERNRYKTRAEQAEGALSGVAANSTDKKARFIATEALAQIDAKPSASSPTLADAYRAGLEAAADKAESMPKGIYPRDVAKVIRALRVPTEFGGE